MAVETQNQTTAAVEPGAGGGAGEGRSTAVTGGAPASLEEMPSMRDLLAEELAGPEVTPDQKDRKPGKGRGCIPAAGLRFCAIPFPPRKERT